MFKPVLIILVLFPVCLLVDYFNGTRWLAGYTQFIREWWNLLLVLLLCKTIFPKAKNYKYDIMEDMRVNQYLAEIQRYFNTPYVPPIMLLYLKNPPGSIRPTDYAYINDTFYRLVVNSFRDRVYVLQDFDSIEPWSRPTYFDVIGIKNITKCLLYLLVPFIWIFFVHFILEQSMLTDWPLLTLPFTLAAFQRGLFMIEAFIKFNPLSLEQELKENDCVIQVTWRDAFPDREVGITFVRAYYLEMERRQRCELTIQGLTIPDHFPEWKNPHFAPFPYPSKTIPSWGSEYEPYYEKKSVGLNTQLSTKNSNVVSFPKIN
ncbi:hypothetical protein [Lysinibacillus sphaericus]|uniref:hypothetical protein n=1 Tax=Lysinibacillus sphaericus TaxID=1421 RepID=UPI000C19A69E|nr:hypothetical protein [Lysinibacillus sphaericus]PIJ98017.1 hypothetical protein CTN02_09745 [Lysinibacillus sphaericus]